MTTKKVTTRRVQLELAEASMARLTDLKEKTEAASYAEVIKNSLRLYEDVIEKYEEGCIFFIRKDDKEIEYRIF